MCIPSALQMLLLLSNAYLVNQSQCCNVLPYHAVFSVAWCVAAYIANQTAMKTTTVNSDLKVWWKMKSSDQVYISDYNIIKVLHKNINLCMKNQDNKSEMSKNT